MGATAVETRTGVVIVDDDPDVRFLLATIIELDERFEVVAEASHAKEGLAAVEATNPDVILVDLDLGSDMGSKLIRDLRRTGSDACVVVVTGSDDPREHAAAFNAGANAIQAKAAMTSTLVGNLADLVAGHAARATPGAVETEMSSWAWLTGWAQYTGRKVSVPAYA